MGIPFALKIWALFILPAVAEAGACPGKGGCQTRQLGSPNYRTLLLQCNNLNCQSAVFAPAPNPICIIRYSSSSTGSSAVRIYLSSCSKVNANDGYLLTNAASVVNVNEGLLSRSTLFNDTSCATYCNAIEVVKYVSNGKTLIDDNTKISTSSSSSCEQAFFVYPNVIPSNACRESGTTGPTGPTGPTGQGPAPKKQCPSRTRQLALLTFNDGESTLAVGSPMRLSDGSYQLPIVEEGNGERFYIQSYLSQAIGASGAVESVTAYTLQLVKSRKYLVSDVSDDTTLNFAGTGATGLNLEDATEFSRGYAQEADYRFFVAYNVAVNNQTATFFCPLFYRNYCLFPNKSRYLSLSPLARTRGSLEPTFENPSYAVFQNLLQHVRSQNNESVTWLAALKII